MSDKEDKEKETLESHLTSEQDLSPRQSVRLSKLPIFIAVGLALVMFIFFAVGVGSKSQPKLSDEEKDAKALEVDKEKSQGKTGYTRDDLNSRSRTDIKGTIIEQLENQENNFQGDPNDQKEMVVQSTDEKDLANEQAMRDLLAMNNKLQAELLELKKKEVMSGKGGMAKIDEEELKAKKNMQHEIAGLKQRAFMQALTASSKTDVTSVNMRYFNKSNDALNEENGSLTGIKEQQQDLRTRINETNKRLSAMQSNNTGTQVIGGRGGNGYVDGLTPPPTVREVNNRGTPSTTASPDAYAVFEHSGEWDLQNQLVAPISDYIVRAGMVIPATLISGITSETQGQIMGQVSQNVYDTATGKYLLIPQGTRLVGTYQTGCNSSVIGPIQLT